MPRPGEVFWAFGAGAVAAVCGIGGGMVMGPKLLSMGVPPKVQSATTATTLVLLSAGRSESRTATHRKTGRPEQTEGEATAFLRRPTTANVAYRAEAECCPSIDVYLLLTTGDICGHGVTR